MRALRTALNYAWGWNTLPGDVRSKLLALLDPHVRAYWDEEQSGTKRVDELNPKTRWRPPPARAERFT